MRKVTKTVTRQTYIGFFYDSKESKVEEYHIHVIKPTPKTEIEKMFAQLSGLKLVNYELEKEVEIKYEMSVEEFIRHSEVLTPDKTFNPMKYTVRNIKGSFVRAKYLDKQTGEIKETEMSFDRKPTETGIKKNLQSWEILLEYTVESVDHKYVMSNEVFVENAKEAK